MRPASVTCLGLAVSCGFGLLAVGMPALGQAFEPTAAERQAAETIRDEVLRAHVRFLADDLLEGRGPGSRGDHLSRRYIATQFESLGLKPAAPGGDWYQPVPLVGVTTHVPAVSEFRKGEKAVHLKYRDDFIANSGLEETKVHVQDRKSVV